MIVTVNGKEKLLNGQVSIAELVQQLALDKRKIAIERNLEIISRSQYENTMLNEGDKVEIIHFIGGG